MSLPDTLRELHRLHVQLSDLRDRIDRGPKQIKARAANVVAAEQKLTHIQTELRQARMGADQKQLQLKSSEAKIEDYRTKLNAAQSNREYQALKDQIAASEMANSVLQDEILEILEKIDVLKTNQTEAEQGVIRTKDDLAKFTEQVKAAEAGLQSEYARIDGNLKSVETDLPNELIESYKRIIQSRGADALAPVENNASCSGCYQQMTTNMVGELNMGKAIFCKSCGRLLYLPENLGPSLSHRK